MFTKKPERQTGKPSDSAGADTDTLTLRKPFDKTDKAESAKGLGNMVPSIIGEDLSVTGNIVSKGEVQIEGEIQGDIHCSSLVIGDKAHVTGGVVADDVVVRGRVVGSIRGIRVTLQSSSHVEGDIYHQSLAIEQGAFFEGKSRRADDPTASDSSETGTSKTSSSAASTSSSSSGSGKSTNTDTTTKAQRAAE